MQSTLGPNKSLDTRNAETKRHGPTSRTRGPKKSEPNNPRDGRDSNPAVPVSQPLVDAPGSSAREHGRSSRRDPKNSSHDKHHDGTSRRPHGRNDEAKSRDPKSRKPREGDAKDKSTRGSRMPPLTRRPIWGERGEDTCAPNHKILRDKAPDHTDAPWYVRMWIAAYMRYRGLDDNLAAGVHYTGAEFHELSLEDMVELFIHKCGVKQKEAQILGRDVWECIHIRASSTQLTMLTRYANFVGEDAQRLEDLVAEGSGIFARLRSIFFWIRALIKMFAMTYVGVILSVIIVGCVSVFVFESEKARKAQLLQV